MLLLVIGLLLAPASGCYYAHAAWEQARILAARQPIPGLLQREGVPDSLRRKLAIVLDARVFARESVGLKLDGSFNSYSEVGRDTLLLLLSAAQRDTLVSRYWSFPIVGRFPYKGYFDFDAARRDAARLERTGLDTYLRPSDAFSTLGWFNDPLLSTTLRRDSIELVNTILHELTHNTVFVKGHADFNESFASFVGARGAVEFFRARGSEAAALAAEARWQDEQLLAAFWRRLAVSVDSALRAHRPGQRRLLARDTVYAEARRDLVEGIGPRLRTVPSAYGERVQLNNASVLARRVYGTGFHLFEALYACEGRRLAMAISRVAALGRLRGVTPFSSLEAWLTEAGCASARPDAGPP